MNNNKIEDCHENDHDSHEIVQDFHEKQVNSEEIKIEISNSNKQDKPWYKKKIYIISSIIGAAIILITIIVLICVLKKSDSHDSKDDSNNKIINFSSEKSNSKSFSNSVSQSPIISSGSSSSEEQEEEIIKYKISSNYFESINNINITINLKQNFNLTNTRRLDDNTYEFKKNKTIKTIYLFNVIPKNNELFTAYIAILSREEISEGLIIKNFNDSEIINSNNNNNYKAVAKFEFYKNGTKKETSFSKNSENIYRNEIETIIPSLIPSLTSNKNKLNNNSYKIKNSVDEPFNIGNDTLDYLYDSEIEAITLNDQVNTVKMNSTYILVNENERDNELNEISTINSLFKSIETTSNQNIKFLKDDGELLAKKYEEKFKNLEFEKTSSNKLRLLTNEKFVENIRLEKGNGKEFKNNKNIRELNIADFTYSLEFPFSFKNEIFKINTIGFELALTAVINWIPSVGFIIFELSYKKGRKVIELDNINLNIPNYEEVVRSFNFIILTIIKYLINDILMKLEIENYDKINNSLNAHLLYYTNNLNQVLIPLSTLFNDSLKTNLDQFKENIFQHSRYIYNELYDYLNYYVNAYISSVENQIKTGKQTEINNIIDESNITFINLINTQKEIIINLINSSKNFISNSIIKLKDIENIDIDYYYRFKEIFKRLDFIIDSFNDKIITSMEKEYFQLQSFVNDNLYMNKLDSLFDKIEVIWDIFYNNKILNETILLNRTTEILNILNNVRNRYLNIKDTLLSSVNNVYEIIENNILLEASSYIQSLKNELNIEEQNFRDFLTSKVRFNTDYTFYNEDIIKITVFENEISKLKINAFETNIINKLDEITTESFISSSEINNISNEIKNEANLLFINLENGNSKYLANINNILSIFQNLTSDSKINNIISSINKKFNSTFLITLLNNYYKNIIDNDFSTKLYDEIINNSLDKYLYEPVELIIKIKSISKNNANNAINLNNKLTTILNEKMSNLFNSIISIIENFITIEINYIIDNLSDTIKDIYNRDINEFYNQSKNCLETLENKKINYISSINSEFDILPTINKNEELIEKYINEISNNLSLKFYDSFCKENSSKCYDDNNKLIDENDEYYFHISKLRDALNHLILLQPYINDVINDNNLKNLSSIDFVNLYKNPNDLNINTIIGEFKGILLDLNNEGSSNINNNVNNLKNIIQNLFYSGYNLSDHIYISFFKTLFNLPNDLEENLDKIFIDVIRLVRKGYIDDINYLINIKFYFDVAIISLEKEFNDTIDDYINKLKIKQNNILDSLNINNEFYEIIIEIIKDKIYNDINIYQNELLIKITSFNEDMCNLLDYNITLENIVKEAIDDLKNEIFSYIRTNLSIQYKVPLNEFKSVINEYFDKFNNDFKGNYRYYFNQYRNVLLKYTEKIKSSFKVTKITTSFKEGLETGLNYSLDTIENLINDKFLKMSNDKDKIKTILNELFINISLSIPNIDLNLNNNIMNLKITCEQELKREEDSFKDKILDFIVIGFNNSVKAFINEKGKFYIDGVFLNDYENEIISKLDYIMSKYKEIDEYIKLIIDGLYNINSNISDSINEVYYQLMNFINDGINQNKVTAKILKKIVEFKYDSATEIVDYFNSYILDILNSNSFKEQFSLKIQNLIPTIIPKVITLNLTNFYYEFLNSSFLDNIYNIYNTKIYEKREIIIEEVDKLRIERINQIGNNVKELVNDPLTSIIAEYKNLNDSLSNFNNDFSFDLSDTKKQNISNLLASNDLKNFLNEIPNRYKQNFELIQRNINNNVSINTNLTVFQNKLNNIKNFSSINNNFDKFEEIKELFKRIIDDLFKNFETNVKEIYNLQVSNDIYLKPINFNLRNLNSNNIQIESIQSIIEQIDIKFINLTNEFSNPKNLLSVSNVLNKIKEIINVQLNSLNNTLETYLTYAKFYLQKTEVLNQYKNNMTIIYDIVKESLNNYVIEQSEIIKKIYDSLSKYKDIYDLEIKLNLIAKINKIIKESSKFLINRYLANSDYSEIKNFKINLSNFNDVNVALGSLRLNSSVSVDNTILKYGYKFTINPENYKVYLNIFANVSADAYITYQSEYLSTNIAGRLGEGMIGLDLEIDFLNENVNAIYKTEFNNTSIKKELYENTTVSAWNNCNNSTDCFVSKNNDYCPNNYFIEDGEKKILTKKSQDNYNKSNIYKFIGYNENKICSYSRYLFEVIDELNSFNSSLNTSV